MEDLRCGVWGAGFIIFCFCLRVQFLGRGLQSLGFTVQAPGGRFQGREFRVWGLE